MAGARIKIEGLRALEEALGALPKATGKNVLRRVAFARLQPVAEAMRQRAPVDDADLVESITVTTKSPTKRYRKQSTVEAHAGPGRNPQGVLQEFGTVNHAPQAFARPSWDAEADAIPEGVGEDLWAEISKAADRLARKAARSAARGS
ncbi:MAG: HK97 gp10 family phage protein [Brevundimonas sp.]|uniref:HK97 gp10 family phage protein n=1 Tax=Brevundimonas sp. TaxID=1871086 RepID=UPI0011F5B811|nr:HK97 gp10 family phage protein [Brevundimonas sp.]RZJ19121.1 MAG: HK97 gp10 family phage protein [Brevundimonas sp.]